MTAVMVASRWYWPRMDWKDGSIGITEGVVVLCFDKDYQSTPGVHFEFSHNQGPNLFWLVPSGAGSRWKRVC